MKSPAWHQKSAIVIVWDEDDYTGFDGCCGSPVGKGAVGTFVLGGARAPALGLASGPQERTTSWKPANHYTMLGTLQKLWGLSCLANTCGLKNDDLLLELFE